MIFGVGWFPFVFIVGICMIFVINSYQGKRTSLDLNNIHDASVWGVAFRVSRALNENISPNVIDEFGNTPLHYALHYGHVDVVKLLLESGANLHCHNHKGKTPLDLLETALAKKRIDEVTYSACKAVLAEHTSA